MDLICLALYFSDCLMAHTYVSFKAAVGLTKTVCVCYWCLTLLFNLSSRFVMMRLTLVFCEETIYS